MAIYTENNTNNKVTPNSYILIISYLKRIAMFVTILSFVLNLIGCSFGVESILPEDRLDYMLRETAKIDSNSALKSVASFPIGAAFSSNIILRSKKAYDLFFDQYNSKTVHAYMKIEPVEGQFNFKEQDYWTKLAQGKSMKLHGHCLVYHEGAPDWLTKFSGSTSEFELAVKNHIQVIVRRYKGKVRGWDVINEIYYNAGGVKSTAFRKMYKDDATYMEFVKHCFVWAHEADPDALLFYSDYGTEISSEKIKVVNKMVNDFKRSGVPIHGFSSHMHISLNTPNAGIVSSLRQLSITGIQIHISELDIKVNPKNDQKLTISAQLLNAQRVKYQIVAMAYKQSVPVNQQYGITLWDFSDADSWIVKQQGKSDAPCIFDIKYDKKPAFYGLMEGLIN